MSSTISGRPTSWVDWLQSATGIAVAALVVSWNLDAAWIVGDELNAIHYLRDGFLDYVRHFHYGLPIKVQVWAIHGLFGNDFGWYRVPAAIGAILACTFLFLARPALRGRWDFAALLAVFLLAFNGTFLYFARWGMPNYAEAMAASALLLALLLRDLQRGPDVHWTFAKIVLACLLPWLYPGTIVLLGGVSTYLGLALIAGGVARRGPLGLVRGLLHAATPLLLGLLNLGINLGMRSAEDWERARGHHATFTEWATQTGGGWFGFLVDGATGLFADLTGTAVGGGGAETFATGYAALWLLAGLSVVVAPFLVLRLRTRPETSKRAQSMFRAIGLLATIVVSTVVVTSIAALADSFPIGSARYVLHLFPACAFLVVFSLAATGWAVERTWPRAWGVAACTITVAILLLSAMGIASLAGERAATEARETAALSTLRSDRNLAIVSWDPGFFLPAALFPESTAFFQVGAGHRVPAGLVPLALGSATGPATTGAPRDLAFFARSGRLVDSSGHLHEAVSGFAERAGYELAKRVPAGKYEVVVFTPRPGARSGRRTVEAELVLPRGMIVSIRIEPTELRGASVSIGKLALASGDATTDIDLCGDRRLQLVRTTRLRRTDDGCLFRFGNEQGSGWIAPTSLRNLGDTGAPRHLRIAVAGELGLRVKVYLDVGQGYGSRDMLAIDVPSASAPEGATDGNAAHDAIPGNQ